MRRYQDPDAEWIIEVSERIDDVLDEDDNKRLRRIAERLDTLTCRATLEHDVALLRWFSEEIDNKNLAAHLCRIANRLENCEKG